MTRMSNKQYSTGNPTKVSLVDMSENIRKLIQQNVIERHGQCYNYCTMCQCSVGRNSTPDVWLGLRVCWQLENNDKNNYDLIYIIMHWSLCYCDCFVFSLHNIVQKRQGQSSKTFTQFLIGQK